MVFWSCYCRGNQTILLRGSWLVNRPDVSRHWSTFRKSQTSSSSLRKTNMNMKQIFGAETEIFILAVEMSLSCCSPLEGQASSLVCPRWQKSNVSPNRSLGKLRRRETGQEKQPNFTFPLFLCQSEDKFGQGLGPCYRNLQRQKISFAMILIFDVSCHSKGQKYIWSKSITGPAQCILQ